MSAEGLEPSITPLAAERSTIELRAQRGESMILRSLIHFVNLTLTKVAQIRPD